LPFGQNGYDKVILDVDSAGEQIYPLERDSDESQASESRETLLEMTVRYREAYVQLLLTALAAVRVGGRVVYCAPSNAHEEHHRIVFRVLHITSLMAVDGVPWVADKENLPSALTKRISTEWASQTKRGWLVTADGEEAVECGPFHIAVLKKKAVGGHRRHRLATSVQWELPQT
jgi:hypothetical protein